MALPNPHGSASGQIGHNSSFDVGVTPGSVGGKFVGFGEQGTSAVANRAAWALSQNIDYVYQNVVAKNLAFRQMVAFTSTGLSTYQITGTVFCGDVTYPGGPASDPEGMFLLFSVLDDQYNELSDALGNEVRVKVVRETTNTTDVYKTGFIVNPVLTFHTVDPVTGVEVTNPYPIPNATNVKLLYGRQGTLEAVPTDAFTRHTINSGNEAEAGAGPSARIVKALSGNRIIDKGGAITFTNASGLITLPVGMYVSLNGVPFNVGGLTFNASNNVDRVGVINSSGAFVEKLRSAVLATDVLITAHSWDGATFTKAVDTRWVINKHSGSSEVTVSAYDNGSDYQSMQEALNYVAEASAAQVAGGNVPLSWVIRVIGNVDTTAELVVPTAMTGYLTIVGENGTITAAAGMAPASHLLDCNSKRVTIENCGFKWSGASGQGTGKAAIYRPGSYSSISNVRFEAGGATRFAKGVLLVTGAEGRYTRLSELSFTADATEACVDFADQADCSVRNSLLTVSGVGTGVLGSGARTNIDSCYIDAASVSATGAYLGFACTVTNNRFVAFGGNLATGLVVRAVGLREHIVISGNKIDGFNYGIEATVLVPGSGVKASINVTDNLINGSLYGYYVSGGATDFDAATIHNVKGNYFTDTIIDGAGVYAVNGRGLLVTGNKWANNSCTAVYIGTGSWGNVSDNQIDSFNRGPGGVTRTAIWVAPTTVAAFERHEVTIQGNRIDTGNLAAGTATSYIYNQRAHVAIKDNMCHSGTATQADHYVRSTVGYGVSVEGNQFGICTEHAVFFTNSGSLEDEASPSICNNYIGATALSFSLIYVKGFAGAKIIGNSLGMVTGATNFGTAIYVEAGVGAGDTSDHTQIKNNYCYRIKGAGPSMGTYYSVIDVIRGAGSPSIEGFDVSGNVLFECGDTTAGVPQYLIFTDTQGISGGRICDNTITDPVMGSEEFAFIFTNTEKTLIDGNFLKGEPADWTACVHTDGVNGIWVLTDHCSIKNNTISWTGSTVSGPLNRCIGIRCDSTTRTVCSDNYIDDYEVTSIADIAAKAAIYGRDMVAPIAVANFSRSRYMDFTGPDTTGRVVLNVSLGDGTGAGSHPVVVTNV